MKPCCFTHWGRNLLTLHSSLGVSSGLSVPNIRVKETETRLEPAGAPLPLRALPCLEASGMFRFSREYSFSTGQESGLFQKEGITKRAHTGQGGTARSQMRLELGKAGKE